MARTVAKNGVANETGELTTHDGPFHFSVIKYEEIAHLSANIYLIFTSPNKLLGGEQKEFLWNLEESRLDFDWQLAIDESLVRHLKLDNGQSSDQLNGKLARLLTLRSDLSKKSDLSGPQFTLNWKKDFPADCKALQELIGFKSWQDQCEDVDVEMSATGSGEAGVKVGEKSLGQAVIKHVQALDSKYGYTYCKANGLSTDNPATVVVEYSSPNIAKPFHAGHLRSTIIGNFVSNLYERLGHRVHRLNYLGDWGTQFGLLMVGFQKYGNYTELQKDPMQHLFQIYVKVNQDADSDKKQGIMGSQSTHNQGMEAFTRMEQGDKELLTLWKKFMDLSMEDYREIYKRLGVEFTEYHSESMYRYHTEPLLRRLTQRGLLQFEEETGVGYVEVDNLSQLDQRKASVVKSDGSSLYITRDISALIDRYSRYKFDKIHYVVENGQYMHFKHLCGIIQKLEPWANSILSEDLHIRFGRVEGMSTRRGQVVLLKDILDEAKEKMIERMKSKETTKETEDIEGTADVLGISGIIVQDLSQQLLKNYKFSWDRMLNFKADSGVFLQYTHARLCSIQRNSALSLEEDFDPEPLTVREAQLIILHLARYEDVVELAVSTMEPYHIVQYLCQLCHFVNAGYRVLRLKGSPPDVAQSYLQLFDSCRITLANGMTLLGLKPLEKM